MPRIEEVDDLDGGARATRSSPATTPPRPPGAGTRSWSGTPVAKPTPVFTKLDPSVVDEELPARLRLERDRRPADDRMDGRHGCAMYLPAFFVRQKFAMIDEPLRDRRGETRRRFGQLMAVAEQKRMAFKEQVTFYSDETAARPVFGFQARKVMDLGAGLRHHRRDGQHARLLPQGLRRQPAALDLPPRGPRATSAPARSAASSSRSCAGSSTSRSCRSTSTSSTPTGSRCSAWSGRARCATATR